MSLALSSSYSHLISALATISSSWGVKTAIISLSKVFKGPAAALPAAVFLGIITVVLYNFRCLFFPGVLVYTCRVLRVCVLFVFLVLVLGVLFLVL